MRVYYLLPCFCCIFIVAVIQKEVEILGTKKIEAKNKHHVNQKFHNAIHNEIIENKWLSGESINLAQTILFKDFPLISGFEDTTLCPLNMFPVQTGELVQVLHENNHWVTVPSPTESATSVVFLYDSLQKESLNKNPVKQIARLRKSEDAELRIISKAVQQQGNGYDCGIFAIAFATDIAYNHKPEQRTYNQSVMRKHLLAQLENEIMTPFPQQTKQVKRGKEVTHRFPLYCKCRVPFFKDDLKEDKGFFMAFCSVCGEWYHKRCENVPVAIFRDEKKAAVWKYSKCK